MKVTVIPIVIGALGMVIKDLVRGLEIGRQAKTIQTTALLGSARILRRVLERLAVTQTPVRDEPMLMWKICKE